MYKVLLPSDLSDFADNALRYAIEFCKSAKAALSVIYINEKGKGGNGFTSDVSNFNIDFVAYKKKWENQQDVTLNFVYGEGDAVEEIETYLNENHYNLLIIGTKGKTALSELLFGSVSQKIISNSKISVLAIPENATYQTIEHIAFSTDLVEMKGSALEQLHDFAKQVDANFHFVHIVQEATRSFNDHVTHFKLVVAEILGEDQFEIISIENDDVLDGLNDYTNYNQVDILVMLRHEKSNLNKLFTISYPDKMAKHSKIPVLIFREK